jgi:type IV secretory pathway VirB2 component (pilin)
MKTLHRIARVKRPNLRPSFSGFLLFTLLLLPLTAHAQTGSSPFDTGLTSLQTLFTGTIAKVSSLIAIVVGGYAFAHGEPGAKKTLAGVAAGTGIAVMATNILTWLWGLIPLGPRYFAHASFTREGLYDRTHTETPKSGLQGSA